MVSKSYIEKRYKRFLERPRCSRDEYNWTEAKYRDYEKQRKNSRVGISLLWDALPTAKMFFLDYRLLHEKLERQKPRSVRELADYSKKWLPMPYRNTVISIHDNGSLIAFFGYGLFEGPSDDGWREIFYINTPINGDNPRADVFMFREEKEETWWQSVFSDGIYENADSLLWFNKIAFALVGFFDEMQVNKNLRYIQPVTKKNKDIKDGLVGNDHKYYRLNLTPSMGVDTGITRGYQPRRNHEVRGHWRTYANGNRTWVRSHKRGDETLGIITKDYILEAAE